MNIEIEFSLPLLLVTIPVFTTWLVYFTTYKISKHRWKAIHLSVQTTAIFYIIAVTILLQNLLQYQLIGTVLIFLILLLAIILIIQRKRDTEVLLGRGLKVLSRLSFLMFGCLYLVLITYEIVRFFIDTNVN